MLRNECDGAFFMFTRPMMGIEKHKRPIFITAVPSTWWPNLLPPCMSRINSMKFHYHEDFFGAKGFYWGYALICRQSQGI